MPLVPGEVCRSTGSLRVGTPCLSAVVASGMHGCGCRCGRPFAGTAVPEFSSAGLLLDFLVRVVGEVNRYKP